MPGTSHLFRGWFPYLKVRESKSGGWFYVKSQNFCKA